jgi:hypothetical protein
LHLVAERKVRRTRRKSIAGQGVLMLLGLQVFFFTSFVAINLPTGTGHNLLNAAHFETQQLVGMLPVKYQERVQEKFPRIFEPVGKIRYDLYSPQAPVAIFLGYVLGYPMATVASALFLLLGVIGPLFGFYLFASGGGLGYYAQPGFGYLLGMVAATWVVGLLTRNARSSLSQIGGLAAGLLTLHLVGLAYLLGSSLIFGLADGMLPRPDWLPWVFEQARNLSWYPLPYDAIFGLLLIGASFPLRYLVGVLTAPDIALRSNAERYQRQTVEELLH